MIRRLLIALTVSGVLYLLGVAPLLAQRAYNLREYEELAGKRIENFSEAPVLRTKVAAGELPPVEERLPEQPVVIEPVDEIGQYGGTVYVTTHAPENLGDGPNVSGKEGILRIASDYRTIVSGLTEKWEFSKDGKTLTLHLRKGIKWSDGVPFTAEDVMCWYEDVFLNEELTPVKSKLWCPGGEPMKMEKLNDYTIRLRFAQSYPTAELLLAHYQGTEGSFFLPKHYIKQFHPRYTPEEKLDKLTKERGFIYWYQLFSYKTRHSYGVAMEPGFPTINSFMPTLREPTTYVLERNPYYWKVDTEGNQLPYIDKIYISMVANKEVMNAKIVTGEVDYAGREPTLDKYPIYKKNAEKGNYRVLMWQSTNSVDVVYMVNQTSKDPVWRKIFQDRRFRIALSLAINREEINEALYFGLANPCQATFLPVSKYYEPEFATAYIKYDPEEANRLLDEMGLKWDKNHEYRLRPDGKRLVVTLEYYPFESPKTPTSELVKEHWKKIGFQINLKEENRGMIMARVPANEVDCSLFHLDAATDIFGVIYPSYFVPVTNDWGTCWGPLWGAWYVSGGEAGEEPPEELKRVIRLWERVLTSMDEEERIKAGKEILRSQAENLWTIGTIGEVPRPLIVRKNLRNIPEKGLWGYDLMRSNPTHPEQYFFKQK